MPTGEGGEQKEADEGEDDGNDAEKLSVSTLC